MRNKEKIQPEDLIRWSFLSKALTGNNSTIRRGRKSKKYQDEIDLLLSVAKRVLIKSK